MKRTHDIACDAYYFKAKTNDWYFSGIEGFGDFRESCDALKALLGNYDRAMFLGNSMGGYAALAFGLPLHAGLIMAFSPQTRFDADFCGRIGEKRWRTEFDAMRAHHDVDQMAARALWPSIGPARARLFIGGQCPQDLAYAADLEGMPGLDRQTFADSGHDLVHDLRATGMLEQLIHEGLMEL